jgi:hypothetical protein
VQEFSATIAEWCEAGILPDSETLYQTLIDESGLFITAEGPYWDFKDEWPFSSSDEYFGGIARLVCAFANRSGGVIVFGVHDAKRTGGHNRVAINLDKFLVAFRQLTLAEPGISIERYKSSKYGDVDAMLIEPRPAGAPPIRFFKNIGKYKAGVIWIRHGHEVISAAPSHYPILFCRQDQTSATDSPALDGSMPPSPASMRRFVGRMEVVDQLFDRLQNSDEPRTYLHGKGGSGKTTIAYEFARLVKEHGNRLRFPSGDPIDAVIFLSAKEKAFVPASGDVEPIAEPDFTNEADLLRQLLHFGGWTSDRDRLNDLSLEALRRDVVEFFDLTSTLIVLDDVDTLTTKGIDPGSDFLYRTLCRSKRTSKVLYTLRNAPSQSIHNSIEVPGLFGEDYEQFVSECVQQFSVAPPSADFRQKKLPELSERRPLVIEGIVALVRTAGSYDRAAMLFDQHAGENVRDYVFAREWDALANNTAARLALAALSDLNQATSFGDLQTVLQVDPSRVQDSVGAVREMFLHIDEAGQEALYSLAPLTRSFVTGKKEALAGYPLLKARVKAFRRNIQISTPQVAALISKVERLLPSRFPEHAEERALEAWRVVSERSLLPVITEDPLFRSLFGYVCVSLQNPKLTEAREAFSYAIDMRHEPDFKYLRPWFEAEKRSGSYDGWCERIADLVIEGKKYGETDKLSMISRKATNIYTRARERMYTEPLDAQKQMLEALSLHLKAFRLNCVAGDYRADVSETYARNTAFSLFALTVRTAEPWEIFDQTRQLLEQGDLFADPLENPLREAVAAILRSSQSAEVSNRIRARIRAALDAAGDRARWLDRESSNRVAELLKAAEKSLQQRSARS